MPTWLYVTFPIMTLVVSVGHGLPLRIAVRVGVDLGLSCPVPDDRLTPPGVILRLIVRVA